MILRLIVTVAAVTAVTAAPPAFSQSVLTTSTGRSYTLLVTADPATRRIEGTGRVRWRNTSSRTVDEIRLYACSDAVDGAAIDLTSMRSAGRELRAQATWSGAGQSILRVPLGAAVGPGGELEADVRWTAVAPPGSARGGVALFARWFPQFVPLTEAGWSARECRGGADIDADIAAFDVTIDVPAGWHIGATGRELASNAAGGRDRVRFVEAAARDFAWAASRDAVARPSSIERAGGPPVALRLLLRPEHAQQAGRIETAFKEALGNQTAVMPYAFSSLTVIDMPWPRASGPIVFPGLITIAVPWFEPSLATETEAEIAAALSAHFWTQTVGVDAVAFPALTRGLTAYTASRLLRPLVQRRLDSTLGESFLTPRFFGGFIPQVVRSIRADPFVEQRRNERSSVLWLLTLERYLGSPALDAVLTEFAGRSASGRPTEADFAEIAQTVSGRDLRWFFDQAFRASVVFDYGVGRVVVRPLEGRERAFRSTVSVVRYGDGVFSGSSRPRVGPYESGRAMEIDVQFRDGTIRHEHWDGRDAETTFEYESQSSIDRVAVDPNGVLQLDVRRVNNTWSSAPKASTAANRWSAAWMTWLEHVLLGYSALV
jgi:hypothetical protein